MHFEKNARKTLGDTGGLGKIPTRADIIGKLFNFFVVDKRGMAKPNVD